MTPSFKPNQVAQQMTPSDSDMRRAREVLDEIVGYASSDALFMKKIYDKFEVAVAQAIADQRGRDARIAEDFNIKTLHWTKRKHAGPAIAKQIRRGE